MMIFLMVILVLAAVALVYVVMQITYSWVCERNIEKREELIDLIEYRCGYVPKSQNDVWRSHVAYFLDRKYPISNIVTIMLKNDEEYIL